MLIARHPFGVAPTFILDFDLGANEGPDRSRAPGFPDFDPPPGDMASNGLTTLANVLSTPTIRISPARAKLTVFTIRQLAREFDLSLRTLRFWEERELLSPIRGRGDRLYTEAERSRVRDIIDWSAAGLTLREIRSMQLMTDTERRAFLQVRLPELQSDADESYAKRSHAIRAIQQREEQADMPRMTKRAAC